MGVDNTRGRRQKRARPLDAMRESQGQTQTQRPEPEARPEPQLQPAGRRRGRDTDIWHLAELFQQLARANKIELRKGLPVIATEINDLVNLWKMREKVYPHYYEACERRELPASQAAKCWYHPRTDIRQRNITWVEMVEVIMAEFWSRIWDEYALDYFRQYFAEYGRKRRHALGILSAIEAINARPKQPREDDATPVISATMPDVSKEG